MSLLLGSILSTLEDAKTQSKHSMLMEFYKLDKDIKRLNDARWDDYLENRINEQEFRSRELPMLFLFARAKTILLCLN